MTDRQAVYLLHRVNRRYALLNTPIKTDEQVQMWSRDLRAGLMELARAGYSMRYETDSLGSRYVFREPAENLT